MESVADWVHMFKRAVRLGREAPVISPGGIRGWDNRTMRDDCELGPKVGAAIDRESFAGGYDVIVERGYHANPVPLLEMLPA